MFLVSQILASIAFILEMASFQFKSRGAILLCMMATTGLLSAHYFFLGKVVGGLLILLSAARYLVAYFSKALIFMWLFLIAALVLFFSTYQGLESILPLIASASASIASFQTSDKPLRIGLLIATLAWLIYDLVVWSPMGMALGIFSVISNVLGYWRFYYRRVVTPV